MNDVILSKGAIVVVFFFHQFSILIIIPSSYTHSCIDILIGCNALTASGYHMSLLIIGYMQFVTLYGIYIIDDTISLGEIISFITYLSIIMIPILHKRLGIFCIFFIENDTLCMPLSIKIRMIFLTMKGIFFTNKEAIFVQIVLFHLWWHIMRVFTRRNNTIIT